MHKLGPKKLHGHFNRREIGFRNLERILFSRSRIQAVRMQKIARILMGSPAPALGFVRIIVLEVGLLSVLIAGEREDM